MADAAPASGGGGGGWTAIEIIIVIILVIAVIANIQKKPVVPAIPTSTKTTKSSGQTISNANIPACGIVISHPKPLEVERGAVVVSGTVSNCAWNTATTMGSITTTVIDGHGNQISSNMSTDEATSGLSDTADFSFTVPLTTTPTTTSGYLILSIRTNTKLDANGAQVATNVRVPIQFQ